MSDFTEKDVQDFMEEHKELMKDLAGEHPDNRAMKVKFKKLHPDAVTPSYSKSGDAGLDLTSIDFGIWHDNNIVEYRTGLAIEIPQGFVGLIFPRSSICNKTLSLINSVGMIDSGYRGEIKFKFRVHPQGEFGAYWNYAKGERIGQLLIIPYPQIELEEVEELSETERGEGGFGSTGK